MTLIQELETSLAPKRVLSRAIDRIAFASDASFYRLIPQAIAQPVSITEVQRLFQISQRTRTPLVFRAGGTSLSGQSITDGILVDVGRFWRGLQVEENGSLVRLQPGVVGAHANRVLAQHNRRIGPDPASIDAAMLGGILANNASGMCCGVAENSYHTLHSLQVLLPNGLILNTADPDAARQLQEHSPHIPAGLLELKRRLESDPALAARIRRKYQTKNTCGYSLNAFLDYSEPLDILTHILIGSEGTLGFIAEAVLHTLPAYPLKYTALLYFETVKQAVDAIVPLRDSGARAIEIMDRASLRSVEDMQGAPELLRQLPAQTAALLVEYQCSTAAELEILRRAAASACREITVLYPPEFTEDPSEQALLWKIRKGTFTAVGAARPLGTTVIIEDVTFPIARIAEAVTDLQAAFIRHNYPDTIIFGHAKDGNLHFVLTPSFNSAQSIEQYRLFMDDIVDIVVNKYDGAIKAEHGTGRNMAPFVETEWGSGALGAMQDLKSLLDPDHLLNPDVILNPDPQAHVRNMKPLTIVDEVVNACMECGYCEPKCPSRDLTLSPRQRIVVLREMTRLQESGENPALLAELEAAYPYSGLDTCATDGMCALGCPVNINTGILVKHMRTAAISDAGHQTGLRVAQNFKTVERGLRLGIWAGGAASSVLSVKGVVGIEKAAVELLKTQLPLWSKEVPRANFRRLPQRSALDAEIVYFPACISRVMGNPPEKGKPNLIDTFVTVAERAGLKVFVPPDSVGHCCGMPFSSKGLMPAFQETIHHTLEKFWDWSRHGQLPIVIDSSSCAYTLRTAGDSLQGEDLQRWKQLKILDPVEFAHDLVLPRLVFTPLKRAVILHPNCSARKLGLDGKMEAVARRCAEDVTVPLDLKCCGFAGDRGLLVPELTESATQAEAAEVNQREYAGYYSSNLTCEMGMTRATGKPYRSILYLVEEATRR